MAVQPYFTQDGRVLPFDKVMELECIDDWTFRSIVKAYSPTGGENGTYGGHVFAQAAWAAAQTVGVGFVIHNITGWFILGGKPNEHYTYRVRKVRDGYNYCTRTVTVSQIAAHGDMFTCTCSFKREEDSPVDVQERVDLKEVYHDVLKGKEQEPMLHAAAPSNDSERFLETYLLAHPDHFNPIGGLHIRKVDMTAYNSSRHPLEKRQLAFYTLRGALPAPTTPSPPPSQALSAKTGLHVTREANLHACAHLYASDRNSLFIVPNHLDKAREFTRMASLSHSVVFHVGIRGLFMPPEPRSDHSHAVPTLWEERLPLCNIGASESTNAAKDGEMDRDGRKWFVQEAWLTRAAGGRGLHTSRMWDYERGVHIASTWQDGLIRFQGKEVKL